MASLPPHRTLLQHLDWSLRHLHEMLGREQTPYHRDAARERFAHTFALAIKTIHAFAAVSATPAASDLPEPCIAFAAAAGWLDNAADWREMAVFYATVMASRGDDKATASFERLCGYRHLFDTLYARLRALT